MSQDHTVDYTLTALTPIWTGDANRSGDRLITTGLLGSIRWWFEVLVRGLGGAACDPTKHQCEGPQHCVVCELFGCTGWARKFRFEVLDGSGQVKATQINKDQTFKLRFIELRPIANEEWALLDLTLRLIADYGAIGGKTVLKPSDEQSRANAAHHRDYGLIAIEKRPDNLPSLDRKQLEDYVQQPRWHKPAHDGFAWASLKNVWCVKSQHLARDNPSKSSFNRVIGRNEGKQQSQQFSEGATDKDKRLAGRQQESKKVFSFKEPLSARRTFGFVNPDLVKQEEMRRRLMRIWPGLRNEEFLAGTTILQRLLSSAGGSGP